MTQGIIQILITSIIALVAIISLIYTIVNNKRIKKLKKDNDNLEQSIKEHSRHNPNYSYRIKRQVKEFYLSDNGGATIQSLWDGIEPSQDFTNLKIPYSFIAEGDGVKISKPIVKELESSDFPVVMKNLKFRSNAKDFVKYTGNFTILGHCNENNCNIGFKTTQEVEKGYAVDKREADKRYSNSEWNNEYCAAKVMVPMEELLIIISFPYELKYLTGRPFPVCFISGTHTIHKSETEKIKKSFKVEFDKKIILKILDPTPGLTYAISWMPPSKKTLYNNIYKT